MAGTVAPTEEHQPMTREFEDRTRSAPGRFEGVRRDYAMADVRRLCGSLRIEHTLARRGAERLWELLRSEPYVHTLGALTGNQAMQQVRAGLQAINLSGWPVAADANAAGQRYPDQSLYPAHPGHRKSVGWGTRVV